MNGPDQPADRPPQPSAAAGAPLPMLLLVFAFGTAAGVLLAFFGAGFFGDGVSALVLVFLVALLVLGGGGLVLFLFRRPILRSLFGYAEAQVELFADPLARVAQRAIARDPDGATSAARELVGLTLARYSWITTRRWIVASLTALIAALAALAGTALLFRQNELLAAQSALLVEQNAKIQEQTALLSQDVELAEASRNAALAVEITNIAALIGAAAAKAADAFAQEAGEPSMDPVAAMVNVLDPARDLDRGLILRIVSASRAARPYRFLDAGLLPDDPGDKMRMAMERRRGDLSQAYARMAEAFSWRDTPAAAGLIDRPASPERGQLLQVLTFGGVRNLEILNHFGLDLAFAYLPNAELALLTAQGGRLSYADLSGSHIVESDLGGAWLENTRFRRATISRSSFAAVAADRVRPPPRAADAPFSTHAQGADFSGAVIRDSSFRGAFLTAASLDGALLVATDFGQADLSAATLRGAILVGPVLDGVALKAADLDGAILFGPDPLADLTARAAAGTFRADRYRAEPLTWEALMAIPLVHQTLSRDEIAAAVGGADPVRLVRIAPLEGPDQERAGQ